MEFDLVVRGGTIIDGSGLPRFRGDVGVTGSTITTVGRISDRGRVEVDAEGRFVTPGFIDGHTHLDAQINWDPLGSSACFHGITTALIGNCGFTLAPGRAEQMDLLFRNIEQAEEIPRKTMLAALDWRWETFPQYLDVLEAMPKGINYAAYVGHSALRSYVMGERAFESAANEEDLDAMTRELEAALRAGAAGFSTSRSSSHRTLSGDPIASRLATWEEVGALASVMTRVGGGLFQLDNEKHDPGSSRSEYFSRLRTLCIETGRPTMFMLVVQPGDPDAWQERLAYVDAAALAGGRIHPQVNSRELYNTIGFRTGMPFDNLPVWSEFRRQPLEEQHRQLHDPEIRRRLVEVANGAGTLPSELPQHDYRLVAASRPVDFDEIYILDSPVGPYRTVGEAAVQAATTPADYMIDRSLQTDLHQLFGRVLLNFDQASVLAILRHPRTILGVSDAGAHVTKLADSSIPTHFLAYWVRQQQAFTWEEGVRMLTSVPAGVYGFGDRGLVREGMAADLLVLDPDVVAPQLATVEQDFPAGATRLLQRASGITHTIVSGALLFENGEHTGCYPGQLLRGPLARRIGGRAA